MTKKKCTRCSWHSKSTNINCLPFHGNPNADIVLVGEAFGASEAKNYIKTGEPKPFIGQAGQVLENLLNKAKLSRGDVAVMNAIRCYAPGNPTPSRADLTACYPNTFFDLQKIKPKLVVALGASALYQLTDKTELGPNIDKLIYSDKIKCKVFVTYHPAACMYDPKKWFILKRAFKKIPDLLDQEPQEIKHYNYEYITTPERFYTILPKLQNGEHIYLDTEATGLDPYENELTLLQIANTPDIIYILDASMLNIIQPKLKELLETKKIVGQGWEFDAKYLYIKYGINIQHWDFDTCLAEYVISGTKNNDLTSLVAKYVPESYGYDDEVKLVKGAQNIKDRNKLLQYAANDVGVLFKIKKEQEKHLVEYPFFYDIIMPANRILTSMSLRGVRFDLNKLKEVDNRYDKKAKRLLLKALELDSVKACERKFKQKFNPRSSGMVSWLLINYYKLPIIKETEKGNPSVGQKEMAKYAEKHKNEYCMLMEKYRSIQTLRDNFLSGVIPKLKGDIAHTKYSLHATESGRPNSKEPNLLNTPRLKEIKECIIPRDGYVFVGGDEAQVEVRVASVIYDEPNLIEICNDFSKDMHSYITAKAFKRNYDEIYNGYKNGDVDITELRSAGKNITFGILYQMGPAKLAYELGITKDEAIQFIDQYYEGFPNLRKNIELTKQEVIKTGCVSNYFGFKRRWKYHSEDDHKTQREAVNHKVQSTAIYLLYLAMKAVDIRFKKENLDAHLILQVYDSLVAEVVSDTTQIQEAKVIMQEEMENVNKPFEELNRVLLKTDINVGYSLADI